jgi:DNA invertase Pin-like site-specific DNA recombinase
LRDSGGDRQNLSIPQQEEKLTAWCRDNGLLLTRLFKDSATGTKTAGRDQFLGMIDYLSGEVTEAGIVIWEYSRISRDFDDFSYFVADLRRRGYIVHSITDAVPEGLEGRLLEAVITWKNASFSRDLSRNVKRGQAYLITAHHCYPQGLPPKGYRLEPVDLGKRRDGTPHVGRGLVPDETTAPLVTRAFQMRARCASHLEIHCATGLYERRHSYGRMLRSPLYLGQYTFGDVTVADFCPPLIDLPTWQAVQEIERGSLARASFYHPRRMTSPYLLSGLVRCGVCGYGVSGHTCKHKRWPANYYYRCDRHNGVNGCPNLPVERSRLDNAVLQAVLPMISAPDIVYKLTLEVQRQLGAGSAEAQAAITRRRGELQDVAARIRRVVAAISELGHSGSLLDELMSLEKSQREIQEQIAALEATMRQPGRTASLEDVTAALAEMYTTIRGDDFRARQLELRSMMKEVRFTRLDLKNKAPHGTVALNLPLVLWVKNEWEVEF